MNGYARPGMSRAAWRTVPPRALVRWSAVFALLMLPMPSRGQTSSAPAVCEPRASPLQPLGGTSAEVRTHAARTDASNPERRAAILALASVPELTQRDAQILALAAFGPGAPADDPAWTRLKGDLTAGNPRVVAGMRSILDAADRSDLSLRWGEPRRAEATRLLGARDAAPSRGREPFSAPRVAPKLDVDAQLGIADAWAAQSEEGRQQVNAEINALPEREQHAAWHAFAASEITARVDAALPPPTDAWTDDFHREAPQIGEGIRKLSPFRRAMLEQNQAPVHSMDVERAVSAALARGASSDELGRLVFATAFPLHDVSNRALEYEARLRDGSFSLAAYAELSSVQLPALAARDFGARQKASDRAMHARLSGDRAAVLRETNGVARGGNQVRVLLDGVASFGERERLIGSATTSIHLQTFIFRSDRTGWSVARQLVDKAREGVHVRVIFDQLGSAGMSAEMLDFMKAGGVEARGHGHLVTEPLKLNARWHQKHLVVDGRAAIEGGMNIGDEYALGGTGKMVMKKGFASEPFRDVDVLVRGPAVGDVQRHFLENWEALDGSVSPEEKQLTNFEAELARAPGPDAASVRFVHARGGDADVTNAYLDAIRLAQTSIVIENAYVLPSAQLRNALAEAAANGVDVRIMANGTGNTTGHNNIAATAARSYYRDMIAAGVKIYERQSGGLLHAKTAVFDARRSIIGSHNLNGRSRYLDSESIVVVEDPMTATELGQRFDDGLQGTARVTLNTLESTPRLQKSYQKVLEPFGWTF